MGDLTITEKTYEVTNPAKGEGVLPGMSQSRAAPSFAQAIQHAQRWLSNVAEICRVKKRGELLRQVATEVPSAAGRKIPAPRYHAGERQNLWPKAKAEVGHDGGPFNMVLPRKLAAAYGRLVSSPGRGQKRHLVIKTSHRRLLQRLARGIFPLVPRGEKNCACSRRGPARLC